MTNNFVFLKNYFLFSAAGFGADMTAGAAISAAQFSVGKIASDARQQFIYNNISSTLFFEADGSEATAQV
jgi:Ca2+-binding RTX toxin-like protein